jgi:hypothetical protein
MQITPAVHLPTRSQFEVSPWELILRYAAATATTLIAIAGAQLVVPNDFIWTLTAITLVGVPVSLYLRLSDMRIGALRVPRPLWNTFTVLATLVGATYFVFWSLRDVLIPILNGHSSQAFWIRFGAGESVSLLMQVFLLFAAFRSFALISDKDATLTTVPSFSVLLLLIPVHKGIEVVLYFLCWTFVAAILFALDHRSEVRSSTQAYVPAMAPGQDVRLAARSLATILGISLVSAVGISYFITSRDADQRSSTEIAISSLATRLTSMALSLPEVSVNSGPDRQIDFSSSPSRPSRSALWQVRAWTYGGRPIVPAYWRMFSLGKYDGVTWSQSTDRVLRVKEDEMKLGRWPSRRLFSPNNNNGIGPAFAQNSPTRPFPRNLTFPAFDVERAAPTAARQFGPASALVRQDVTAMIPNLGFVPLLPSVRAIRLGDSDQKEIRIRTDGAIDLGVVQAGQIVRVLSELPALQEYGIARGKTPDTVLTPSQVAASGITITPEQRKLMLALPKELPQRVRQLGRAYLANTPKQANNYGKAQRLAFELQKDATYTLRPPTIPTGRDATDYFLFEGGKRGYCTYFAGALTVLCRAEGIPARVVCGFVNGAASDGREGFLLEANSHAWTEVWVDGWGWAVVDATPAGDRGDNAPTWLENWGDWFVSIFERTMLWARERILFVCILGMVLAAYILSRWRGQDLRRIFRPHLGKEEDGERREVIETYQRISRQMSRQFRPKASWETPDEWLQHFTTTLSRGDIEALRRLTSLYLAARYAGRPLPQGSARLARETASHIDWKKLRS